MTSLIHSDNTWALWAILVGVAALSIWLEQRFRWAAKVTGCVIALIAMMLLSNFGVIPTESAVYDTVWDYVVPLAIPLLLFSAAANRISLTVIGFIQYVSPTIALVLAVAFFGEQFTMAHGICFALIWLGIAAIGAEAAWTGRRKRAAEVAPPVPAAAAPSPNSSSAAMLTDAPPAER